MNILFTCAGRRTYLLKYFKEQLGNKGKVIGADMQLNAPALSAADERVIVPAVSDVHYVDVLLDVCKQHQVDVLISLNDLELPILSSNKNRFLQQGVTPIISDPNVIDICFDKLRTCDFILSLGLKTPKTYCNLEMAEKALESGELHFPVVIKPRWGSASIGIEFVDNMEDLRIIYDLIKRKTIKGILGDVSMHDKDYILIQEQIIGHEYGLDVMNDLNGRNVGVAVKRKLAMRAGETDKAVTVDNPELRHIGEVIGENLKHIGNLDCDILEMDNEYYVLELNPRFGGGFPFSYEAGVNLPKAIINWVQGLPFNNAELQQSCGLTLAKCDYLVDMTLQFDDTNKTDAVCSKVRKIAVYGAGGLGREVAGGIGRINKFGKGSWEFIGFYDDGLEKGSRVSHYGQVLGGINELNAVNEPLAVAIAVGTPITRKKIYDKITNPNISFPNIIAPSFKVLDPDTFKIGKGNIIQDNCSATCDVMIGDFNVFNGSDIMGHDDVIGDFNMLMPGVHLSGEVKLGNFNLLGVNSVVLQQIKIGDNVILGAGSVLISKPKEGFTYIGVPAKKFDYK